MQRNKRYHRIKKTLGAIALCTCLTACQSNGEGTDYSCLYKGLPFEMPLLKAPVFPSNEVFLPDFGGKGDGVFLNTEPFREAIAALEEKGGGKLIVPSGIWLTGPIVLKSNINLHLQEKAIILFSADKNLYPLVETVFEGLDTRRCQSPLSARNTTNIAITGNGAIDGNGQAWRPLKREKVTESQWKATIARGGVFKRDTYWMPSAQYLHGDTISDMNVPRHLQTEEEWAQLKDFLRPVMVSLQECRNVFIQGLIFQNSPAWNLHPFACENVIIDGIQVRNPSYAQNGDGLDLESCKNVLVVNSSFDVGDDGICLKSGKDEDGIRRGKACENVIIDNCTVFRGHGGFVVGSEMSGGVRNIVVSNCQFLGTDVGLRFKSKRGRGGVVENIYISKISMIDIATDAIHFNLHYGGKSVSEALQDPDKLSEDLAPVTERTPLFRNLVIRDIHCNNARRAACFNGLPEQPIRQVTLENLCIRSRLGIELAHVDSISIINADIVPKEGERLRQRQVSNLKVQPDDAL